MGCLGLISGAIVAYVINFVTVAICYGTLALGIGFEFSWPACAAIAFVLTVIVAIVKSGE